MAPCGYDYTLIKKIHKSLEPREGTHVTDLVGCLRRTWYQIADPLPERVSEVLYRVMGTAMHSIIEDEGDDNIITELSLEYKGVVGTVDAYYPVHKRLVDHKTTRWLTPSKLPYGDHERQVNIYRWMLEGNGHDVSSMYLHYIDMSGPSKCRSCRLPLVEETGMMVCPVCGKGYPDAHHGTAMLPVRFDLIQDTEEFVLSRKEMLETAVETGNPPESDAGFLCNYCQFRDVCPDSKSRN